MYYYLSKKSCIASRISGLLFSNVDNVKNHFPFAAQKSIISSDIPTSWLAPNASNLDLIKCYYQKIADFIASKIQKSIQNLNEKSPIPFHDKDRKKNDQLNNAHDCSDLLEYG